MWFRRVGGEYWARRRFYSPQRRHRVCDLLWRLPKDEVPFAVALVSQGVLDSGVVRSPISIFVKRNGTHSWWASVYADSISNHN